MEAGSSAPGSQTWRSKTRFGLAGGAAIVLASVAAFNSAGSPPSPSAPPRASEFAVEAATPSQPNPTLGRPLAPPGQPPLASPTPCVASAAADSPIVTMLGDEPLRTEIAFWSQDAATRKYAVVAQNTGADAYVRLRLTLRDACGSAYTAEVTFGEMRRDETRALVGVVRTGFATTRVDARVLRYATRSPIPFVGECKEWSEPLDPQDQQAATGFFDWHRTWLPLIVATVVYRNAAGQLLGADSVRFNRPPMSRKGSVLEVPRTVTSPFIASAEFICFSPHVFGF